MNFKKLLSMSAITLFVTSGTMTTVNTNITNPKLVNNSLINNHETFTIMEGTNNIICSIIASDQKGVIYVASDGRSTPNGSFIYSNQENEQKFTSIFRSEDIIQKMVTSSNGNLYVAVNASNGKNESKIYIKEKDENKINKPAIVTLSDTKVLSMVVYTNEDGEDYIYIGTNNGFEALYPTENNDDWFQQHIDGIEGEISALVVKKIDDDRYIYAGTTAGKIYVSKMDQKFEQVFYIGYKIIDFTIDKLNYISIIDLSGQVWKENYSSRFERLNQNPLSKSLTSIVADENDVLYVVDSIGDIWQSYGSSFKKLQSLINISIRNLIYDFETNKIYLATSAGVYCSN